MDTPEVLLDECEELDLFFLDWPSIASWCFRMRRLYSLFAVLRSIFLIVQGQWLESSQGKRVQVPKSGRVGIYGNNKRD